MNKLITLSFILVCYFSAKGQFTHLKPVSLGVSAFFSDFKTAAEIRSKGIASVIKQNHLFPISAMNPGMAISYSKGLSNHVDFSGTLGGSFVKFENENLTNIFEDHLLVEVTTSLNFKLLPDNYVFVPFVDLGVGASKYINYYSAFAPVGLGLQVKLFNQSFLILNSQYRIPVTNNSSYHFYHSITLIGSIAKEKNIAVKPNIIIPVVIADRDGDGIPDSLDACPDIPGLAALNGCPDRDGDGIADKDDKCPDVPGIAKYQGCPIPDTDGDGINDEEDKCPTVPGLARYQGCPIPDTDKDGVNDEEDKCPNVPGPAANFGCPVIDEAIANKVNLYAKNIYFASGSANLLKRSNVSLDNVVKILNDDPQYKLDIQGYTDNTGKPEKNSILSNNRAAAVKSYFVQKGINEARITSRGFGADKPIADNKTAKGKAQNRRVEMALKNY